MFLLLCAKTYSGCLPFTQKNRLVDSCSKWDVSNPEWNFPPGCARSISTSFSLKIERFYRASLELVKTSKWNTHFPFENCVWEFWSTFQEIPFSRENLRSGRQNCSFHLHHIRNFRIFLGKWLTSMSYLLLQISQQLRKEQFCPRLVSIKLFHA